jgi:hypothetical protein
MQLGHRRSKFGLFRHTARRLRWALSDHRKILAKLIRSRELTVRGHLRHDLLVVARTELKPSQESPAAAFSRL